MTQPAPTTPTTRQQPQRELPPALRARVNQLASRRGKEEAEIVRNSCMQALQDMADKGVPLDELSEAFKAIEADKAHSLTDLARKK